MDNELSTKEGILLLLIGAVIWFGMDYFKNIDSDDNHKVYVSNGNIYIETKRASSTITLGQITYYTDPDEIARDVYDYFTGIRGWFTSGSYNIYLGFKTEDKYGNEKIEGYWKVCDIDASEACKYSKFRSFDKNYNLSNKIAAYCRRL